MPDEDHPPYEDTDDPGWPEDNAPPAAVYDAEADLDNARRMVDTHGERLRYVVPWKKWLVWAGDGCWRPDDTGQVHRCAVDIADRIKAEHPGARRKTARAVSSGGLAAMVQIGRNLKPCAVAPDILDADPHLLNCANGTLDLRTLELHDHQPADHLTKMCDAAYHPAAAAPEFEAFLARIQPDVNMRDFLARLFGHALLGKVYEHVLPVFYGSGANGKTTLVEAIASVLGDYAGTVEPGLLLDRGETHPTGTAALHGLRLAVTHETDEGRRLAEGTVKRLTGGDKITARRMREDFWTFDPSHSLVMHTNHKPVVRGDDEGIWRRLRLIPFAVTIPEEERDHELPDKLALEREGILAWLINGYTQWRQAGLDDPQPVRDATASYRGESDMLSLFLGECCTENPTVSVRSQMLYDAWTDWCRREGVEHPGSQVMFARRLTDRGYDKQHTRTGKYWHGIGLLDTDHHEPDPGTLL